MNKLEGLHKPAMYWQKRQSLQQIKNQKPMFEQLMRQTRQCMQEHPEFANDVKGAIQCEVIHPQTLSQFSNFTFHTHPHNIDYPSEADIKTTNRLKKEWLIIGLADRNQVVAFNKNDGFKKIVARF